MALHALLLWVSSGAVFALNLCEMRSRETWSACKNGRNSLITPQTVYMEQLIYKPAMLNKSVVCFNIVYTLDSFQQQHLHVLMRDLWHNAYFSMYFMYAFFIHFMSFPGYFSFIVQRKMLFKYLSIKKNLMTAINFGLGPFSCELCSNQAKLDRNPPSARWLLRVYGHVWGLLT